MDKETLKMIRSRYKAEILHAEEGIVFVETYRFVLRDIDNTRSEAELMEEQKALHQSIIDTYSSYLADLERRYGAETKQHGA